MAQTDCTYSARRAARRGVAWPDGSGNSRRVNVPVARAGGRAKDSVDARRGRGSVDEASLRQLAGDLVAHSDGRLLGVAHRHHDRHRPLPLAAPDAGYRDVYALLRASNLERAAPNVLESVLPRYSMRELHALRFGPGLDRDLGPVEIRRASFTDRQKPREPEHERGSTCLLAPHHDDPPAHELCLPDGTEPHSTS